jgi:hypothetical protein
MCFNFRMDSDAHDAFFYSKLISNTETVFYMHEPDISLERLRKTTPNYHHDIRSHSRHSTRPTSQNASRKDNAP